MRRLAACAGLGWAVVSVCPAPAAAQVPPPGYVASWSDEFQDTSIDTATWEVLTRRNSFNNEKQFYLPEQASIHDGDFLRITATDEPFQGKLYRSARLESFLTVLYGRVDVRAKIPTTKGIWPAIWLFPNRDIAWPLGGEIDILEHGGSNPNKISSAYHWNDQPNFSQFVFNEIITDGNNGTPVIAWPDDFHNYAMEWDPHEIRYYVDGFHHFSVVDPSAPAGFLPGAPRMPVSSTPMNVILNTAVGGFFDGDPDGSTVFPQHFDIDYVRTYDKDPAAGVPIRNGDFQIGQSDWFLEGNTFLHLHDPNNNPEFTALEGEGGIALKLFADGTANTTATQYLWVDDAAEDSIDLTARARVNSDDSIAGTSNRVDLSVTFFSQSDSLVGNATVTLADGSSAEDEWLTSTLSAVIPETAVYAKLLLRFWRPVAGEGGAVWVDGIERTLAEVLGDFNGNGLVEQGDLNQVLSNWGQAFDAVSATWISQRPTEGIVDQAELNAVLNNWGANASPDFGGLGAVVPEPGFVALGLGALALLRRRRCAC